MKINSLEIKEINAQLNDIKKDAEEKLTKLESLNKHINKYEKKLDRTTNMLVQSLTDIHKTEFIKFIKQPYTTIPNGKNSILVFVPKFIKNFQIGWLYKENETYYIYELNQYSTWLNDTPKEFLDLVNFSKQVDGYVENDTINFAPDQKSNIKQKLGNFLTDYTNTTARITRGNTFNLIASMIEQGCLPFRPKPVLQSDLQEYNNIKLRDYQQTAYDKFLSTGAVGIFYPTGAGKSFIAMHAIETIKEQKVIIVPTKTLEEQWKYYIEKYIPKHKESISIYTYQGFKNFEDKFSLVIFDECHKLPANTFAKLALIHTKYRMGLSASAHREDNRKAYIFALTGFPIGLDWPTYMATVDKSFFPVKVIITKTPKSKFTVIRKILDDKKTIIFSDKLKIGRKIANEYKIPFIHGATKNRLEILKDNNHVVASRVLDLGTSEIKLQRIIEVDFMFGSRQQELQRVGRLMHSESQNLLHTIIMTKKESEDYSKRLWALKEQGFNVEIEYFN